MNSDNINEVRRNSGWAIALGIFMIVLGIAAIAEPFIATIAITIAIAWTLLIAGIVRVVHAFQSRQKSFWPKFVIGALYIIAGIVLIGNVLGGALSLTLALGIVFLIEGIFEVITAFQVRPDRNWGWTLFSGISAIILGILILYQWPFSAAWVLGLLVGINFLFTGAWMLMLSMPLRTFPNHRPEV